MIARGHGKSGPGARRGGRTRKEPPQLILLDIRLPDMSGFDVCRTLREEGRTLPILMVTARDEEVDKIVGLELGRRRLYREAIQLPGGSLPRARGAAPRLRRACLHRRRGESGVRRRSRGPARHARRARGSRRAAHPHRVQSAPPSGHASRSRCSAGIRSWSWSGVTRARWTPNAPWTCTCGICGRSSRRTPRTRAGWSRCEARDTCSRRSGMLTKFNLALKPW